MNHWYTNKRNNQNLQLYIYIYIYIYANFIKHNRHFMSTYFLLDPFEFPYYFSRILGELIYALSIVACIPSTFCPTLGHHQGRIYYKESTRDTCNYGQYLNQFPPNTIKVIREFERIQKKICRHKMSIMFNEICINEEMPKYTHTHTHTHIYIYIYIYIYSHPQTDCFCLFVCLWFTEYQPFQVIKCRIHFNTNKQLYFKQFNWV